MKNIFIPKLKTSHQNTESATSTSACVETGSKKRLEGSDICLGFFSLFTCPKFTDHYLTVVQFWDSHRKETQHKPHRKAHLTSNVCFKDRCVDINIKVHPLLQHVDNSLELGNISQDLQGNGESGLELTRTQRAVQCLGLILVWLYYFMKSFITDITKKLTDSLILFQNASFTHFRSSLQREQGALPAFPGAMQRGMESSRVNE